MSASHYFKSITVFPHHIKQSVCGSRAKYREGRKDTAVKVYTVNQESVYLVITNVPVVGAGEELRALCDQYGIVKTFQPLDDYPTEEFTEAYLVKYDSFPTTRVAKKQLDDKSFFGGTLHVFYAPEFETVHETRLKLQERRKFIAWKTNTGKKCQQSNEKNTLSRVHTSSVEQQTTTYIWAGKEYTVPVPAPVEANPKMIDRPQSSGMFVPRQCKSSVGQLIPGFHSSSAPKSAERKNPSYEQTISQVRAKISSVSVPNVRVSLKRKKRL